MWYRMLILDHSPEGISCLLSMLANATRIRLHLSIAFQFLDLLNSSSLAILTAIALSPDIREASCTALGLSSRNLGLETNKVLEIIQKYPHSNK